MIFLIRLSPVTDESFSPIFRRFLLTLTYQARIFYEADNIYETFERPSFRALWPEAGRSGGLIVAVSALPAMLLGAVVRQVFSLIEGRDRGLVEVREGIQGRGEDLLSFSRVNSLGWMVVIGQSSKLELGKLFWGCY
ncbi:MAG: hypothetical protein HPY71_06010 [Firmicutes bacterium]|nr:hypothetical protein [Bacillota bacterium]